MPSLSTDQLSSIRTTLTERLNALSGEIQDGNQRLSGEDHFIETTGEVMDAGDASVASEEADLRSAQIDRDVGELRAVERAIGRLDDGSYGRCRMCDEDIAPARLEVAPAAEHCLLCQTMIESRAGGDGAASTL